MRTQKREMWSSSLPLFFLPCVQQGDDIMTKKIRLLERPVRCYETQGNLFLWSAKSEYGTIFIHANEHSVRVKSHFTGLTFMDSPFKRNGDPYIFLSYSEMKSCAERVLGFPTQLNKAKRVIKSKLKLINNIISGWFNKSLKSNDGKK